MYKKKKQNHIQFEELKNKEDEYIKDITKEMEEENGNNDSSYDVPEKLFLSNYIENNLNDYKQQFEIYFYFSINDMNIFFQYRQII